MELFTYLNLAEIFGKTAAYMSLIIILIAIAAWLTAREKRINRGTVEKVINIIWKTIKLVIGLEAIMVFAELMEALLK
jgi:hypothetical protein